MTTLNQTELFPVDLSHGMTDRSTRTKDPKRKQSRNERVNKGETE